MSPIAGWAGSAGRNPDVDHRHLAGMVLAGGDPQAGLAGVKCTRRVSADGHGRDFARRGVDAAGHVAGDNHRSAGRVVDGLDRASCRLARLAGEAGAENRVEDHRRSR